MEFIKNLLREHFVLFLIIILGSILRLWQLGIVPQGVTHDEMGYIFNAYSIALTGKNVFGETMPFLTWMFKGGFPFMPGTTYAIVPIFWIFPLSAMAGRLPSAILGIADISLIYILATQLFQKKNLALLSALFLAVSPWHLHFARSAYDPNFSLFFYLFGTVLFLFEIKTKKLPIFSSLAFLIGIYSYRGMSIVAFPLFFILLSYAFFVMKARKKQIIFFLCSIVIILMSLAAVTLSIGSSYITEGQTILSNPKMQEEIDTKIREAGGPLIVRRIFINKPVQIINNFRENYIKSYSPEFLFLYTEPNQIYSIWSRGRLYFIDLIFSILGGIYLYKLKKKQALFIFSLFLIGSLPGGVGGLPFSARNFFLSIIFPILSSGGVLFLIEEKILKKLKPAIIIAIVIIYAYAISGYLFDYYYRYSDQASESWAKSLKDVSSYINNTKNSYRKIIVAPSSFGDFVQYAFYTHLSPIEVQRVWLSRISSNAEEELKYKNIYFLSSCPEKEKDMQKNSESILYISRGNCLKNSKVKETIRDFYRNEVWKIYN